MALLCKCIRHHVSFTVYNPSVTDHSDCTLLSLTFKMTQLRKAFVSEVAL